jgi:ribonuclease BN (tRNA processing enzyme)
MFPPPPLVFGEWRTVHIGVDEDAIICVLDLAILHNGGDRQTYIADTMNEYLNVVLDSIRVQGEDQLVHNS